MKNKLTLIIDGNWLLNSRMAIIMDRFNKKFDEATLNAAQAELADRLARSIIVMLNKVPIIDNIVLVSDGGSWRKKLVKPVLAQDIVYKGNRQLNVEYSWKHIFGALDELRGRFRELGITYSEHLDVEGDDWCWYWSRRLNEQGISCLIWSVDNDLKQLVQVDNGAFTAWYCNDKTGLYLTKELEEPELDEIEFFMAPSTESPVLNALRKAVNKVTYIDPNTIITNKIICGDGGDNIKSVIRYAGGSKIYKITERDWKRLATRHGIATIQDLSEKENELVQDLISMYSNKDVKNLCFENLKDMIEYNKQLVWLNESVIPENLISIMNEVEYKQYDISYIKSNYKVLTKQNNEVESLFEGIEF